MEGYIHSQTFEGASFVAQKYIFSGLEMLSALDVANKLEPYDMIDGGGNGHKRKAIGEPDDEACDTENAAPHKRQTRNVVNHASSVLSASIIGSRATSASSEIAESLQSTRASSSGADSYHSITAPSESSMGIKSEDSYDDSEAESEASSYS